MRQTWLPAVVALCTLAACNANVVVQVPKANPAAKSPMKKAADSPAPSASPSDSPSVVPSTVASPSASPSTAPVGIVASTPPAVLGNPFGVPASVRLPLPAAVISVGGGNLIGQAGGNLIGQAGGNYRIAQTPPKPLLSVAIPQDLNTYLSSTMLADALLKIAGGDVLKPGVPLTLSLGGAAKQDFTYLLEVKADHAVLSIGRGADARGAGQMVGISYSSPTKGRMVLKNSEQGLTTFLSTDFDLEKGVATADSFGIGVGGAKMDGHWDFLSTPDDPSGKAFVIRSAVAQFDPQDADLSTINTFTAHFLKDGSAVGILGLQDAASNGQLILMPNDGIFGAQGAEKPYDLYIAADGKDIEPAAASAELKALTPTMADFITPLPALPTAESTGEGDPRFAFPE